MGASRKADEAREQDRTGSLIGQAGFVYLQEAHLQIPPRSWDHTTHQALNNPSQATGAKLLVQRKNASTTKPRHLRKLDGRPNFQPDTDPSCQPGYQRGGGGDDTAMTLWVGGGWKSLGRPRVSGTIECCWRDIAHARTNHGLERQATPTLVFGVFFL